MGESSVDLFGGRRLLNIGTKFFCGFGIYHTQKKISKEDKMAVAAIINANLAQQARIGLNSQCYSNRPLLLIRITETRRKSHLLKLSTLQQAKKVASNSTDKIRKHHLEFKRF